MSPIPAPRTVNAPPGLVADPPYSTGIRAVYPGSLPLVLIVVGVVDPSQLPEKFFTPPVRLRFSIWAYQLPSILLLKNFVPVASSVLAASQRIPTVQLLVTSFSS